MKSRREILKSAVAASLGAGLFFHGCGPASARSAEEKVHTRRSAKSPGIFSLDMHCHTFIPEIDAFMTSVPEWQAQQEMGWLSSAFSMRGQLGDRLMDVQTRLSIMDDQGVDMQAISPSPAQYYYYAPRDIAADIIRVQNEKLAAIVAANPDRFIAMAAVSLQHPDLAAAQLHYATTELDLRGAIISSNINGADLSDPKFRPFWAKAEELGTLIFVHPLGFTQPDRLSRFFMGNVVGQPLETTLAMSHLIFGGVLDDYPGLKLCLAHGGGYMASYTGRAERCFEAIDACRTMDKPPTDYLRDFYYDSVIFTEEDFGHLVGKVGADRVLLGSDYPYGMGDSDPVERVLSMDFLSDEEKRAVLGRNAARLFGVEIP